MFEFVVIIAWAIWPSLFSEHVTTRFEPMVQGHQPTKLAKSPPPDPEPPVKELLQSLHDFRQERQSLYVEFERTIVDHFWNSRLTSTGSGRVKGSNLARMDVAAPAAISCVLPGTGELWVYEPSSTQRKKSTIHVFRIEETKRLDWRLPEALGWLTVDPLDWADEFLLEINHESELEVTLRLTPVDDIVEVKRVELTWNRTNGLPTMIVLEEHTKIITTYHITKACENIEINSEDFTKPVVPEGWVIIQAGRWPLKLFGR